jgi:hypothetical protein
VDGLAGHAKLAGEAGFSEPLNVCQWIGCH